MGKIVLFILGLFSVAAAGVLLCSKITPPLERLGEFPIWPEKIESLIEVVKKKEMNFHPRSQTEKTFLIPSTSQKGNSRYSLIYLHGFSASPREVSPVFETIAEEFKLPLFMTRFRGHGLGADELGQAKLQDWLEDAVEAYSIGRKLGQEVIIACMSTGCPLALYLAYFYPEKIKAIVMLSPNFGLADPRGFLANGPFGSVITKLVIGEFREFKNTNAEAQHFWTVRYRTEVIPQILALVESVKKLDWSLIKIPVLTLYTPFDNVVSPQAIEENLKRLGGHQNHTIPLRETANHILAGNLQNPSMNKIVIDKIRHFLFSL